MILTISFLGGAFYQMMQINLTNSAQQGLLTQANEMAKNIAPQMARTNKIPLERLITGIGRWSPSNILVTDESGRVIFVTPKMKNNIESEIFKTIVDPTNKSKVSTKAMLEFPNGSEVAVGVPIIYKGQSQGVLVLFKNVSDIQRTGIETFWLVLQAALVSGVLILVISVLMARSMTRSIRVIGEAVEEIAEGNLKKRIHNPGKDEIGDLARNVNFMSERLEILVERFKIQEQKRRDLMADISHEFRTPITTIRGFSEALLDGLIDSEEEKSRSYRIINRQSVHIEKLTHDMLEYSKLDSGSAEMKFEKFNLMDLVERMKESIEVLVKRYKLTFSIESKEVYLPVIGDQQRIEQVITNLVDNATSFTQCGGKVKIILSSHDNEVWCCVQDEGIGIEVAQLERVWNRFYRKERPRSHEYQGTGLGLPIVKQIIETHGGKVWVTSVVGKGSNFYFSLLKAKD